MVNRLTDAEINEKLSQLNGWYVMGGTLCKNWKFRNFKHSQDFVIKVGEFAEQQKHHPDISFGWGYAKIILTTHDAKGLTERDFTLATAIEGIELPAPAPAKAR